MTDLTVHAPPSTAAKIVALSGDDLESVLTEAMRQQDPRIVAVHNHADEVLVQYSDHVDRYDRLVVVAVNA